MVCNGREDEATCIVLTSHVGSERGINKQAGMFMYGTFRPVSLNSPTLILLPASAGEVPSDGR